MRYLSLAISMLAVIAAVAGGALAADRPLAALVPADASTYSEANLDRVLGRAPETAAIGQAFAQMKSPALIGHMWTELSAGDPDIARVDQALAMLRGASEAVGPRVGWATWVPDAQSLMGGMTTGAGGGNMHAAMSKMPKLLLVADIRDAAKFDTLISQLATEANLDVRVTESGGTKTTSFANGMVELIRGADWVAIGFPPEQARKAADRAAGAAGDSLASNPGYQGAIARLPADAALTEYMSAAAVRQLFGLASLMAPAAGISYSADEPLGSATGVRVEQVNGKQMITVYSTSDLKYVDVIDAALAIQVTMLKPMIERGRESARKAQCLSNMKKLAMAAQMFAADNDDHLPQADDWVQQLQPYVDNPAVFRCPEDKSGSASSYAMNEALSGVSLDEIEDPSAVVLFYETATPGDNPAGDGADLATRHLGGGNYAFADGHCEWFGADEEQPSFDVGPAGEET